MSGRPGAVPTGRARRRAFVLFAALVVGMSALLIATGLLFGVQADAAGAAWRRRDATLRSLALSGVRAVVAELDRQRDRVLGGERVECPSTLEIWERDGRVGMVRLLPVGSSGDRLLPENGKLDLNRVSAEALAATGLVESVVAESIVRERAARGSFSSLHDLLEVPGVSAVDVYGPLAAIDWTDAAIGPDEDLGERIADRLGVSDDAETLADLLTVHAVEPLLQRNGRRRIGLDVPWSDELGSRIDERFGEGASNVIRQIIESGFRFNGDASIVTQLRRFDVAPDEWGGILDGLTGHRGTIRLGALDVNTATPSALRGIGLTPEQVEAIVDARDAVPAEARADASWIVAQGMVPPDAYEALVDRVTARSWCWRVRVAAFEVDVRDGTTVVSGPIVLEAVVDLSEPSGRVAYLRDVTYAQLAAGLAGDDGAAREAPESPDDAPGPDAIGGEAGVGEIGSPSPDGPRANRPSRPSVNRPRGPGRADDRADEGSDESSRADEDLAPSGPSRVSRWLGPGG